MALGSPLGPLFANIFFFFHKTNWLNDCPPQFKPLYYRRYVDDSFILFRSRDHILPFVSLSKMEGGRVRLSCDCRRTVDDSALVPDLRRVQSMGLYISFLKPYNSQFIRTTRCLLRQTSPKAFLSQAFQKETTP